MESIQAMKLNELIHVASERESAGEKLFLTSYSAKKRCKISSYFTERTGSQKYKFSNKSIEQKNLKHFNVFLRAKQSSKK